MPSRPGRCDASLPGSAPAAAPVRPRGVRGASLPRGFGGRSLPALWGERRVRAGSGCPAPGSKGRGGSATVPPAPHTGEPRGSARAAAVPAGLGARPAASCLRGAVAGSASSPGWYPRAGAHLWALSGAIRSGQRRGFRQCVRGESQGRAPAPRRDAAGSDLVATSPGWRVAENPELSRSCCAPPVDGQFAGVCCWLKGRGWSGVTYLNLSLI